MLVELYCTIVMVNYIYYHEYSIHGHTYGLCMALCGCVGICVWAYRLMCMCVYGSMCTFVYKYICVPCVAYMYMCV